MDSVTKQIKELMDIYKDEVDYVLMEAAQESAEEAAYWVSQNSPKKSGKYSHGWRTKHLKKKSVVYNATHPGLTMLLEYGHAKSNGAGRVAGQPHIKPAEEKGNEKFVETVLNGLDHLL